VAMDSDKKLGNLSFIDKTSLVISTVFGIGYTPLCPGSAACVAAVLVFLIIKNQTFFLIFTAASIILAFVFPGRAEKIYAKKDDKHIVIDDFSGMLLSFLFIPRDVPFAVVGFFIFRMFDMLKIHPADRVEKYPGAIGITSDDLIAGAYANIILQIVRHLPGVSS